MHRLKELESGYFSPKFFFLLRFEVLSNFERKAGTLGVFRRSWEGRPSIQNELSSGCSRHVTGSQAYVVLG